MPRYDYVCPECLNKIEVFMTYEQLGSVELWCHRCSTWIVRPIMATAIAFRGPGFYCTDNQEEHGEEG